MVKNLPAYAGDTHFDPCVGKIPWRRKWQPTPVILPEKSHGQRGLEDSSPWDHKEADLAVSTTNNWHITLCKLEMYNVMTSYISILQSVGPDTAYEHILHLT